MEKIICKFSGKYSFLSNFHLCDIIDLDYPEIKYPSLENAYQASKTSDKEERKKFTNITPGQSKRLGRKVKLREDWDSIRIQIMEQLLRQKFKQPLLKDKLLKTNGCKLIEGNNWNDYFWGICNGKGHNNLGKLLMQIRLESTTL